MDLNNTIIDFGKYNGQTFIETLFKDFDYCCYVVKTPPGKNKTNFALFNEYLQTKIRVEETHRDFEYDWECIAHKSNDGIDWFAYYFTERTDLIEYVRRNNLILYNGTLMRRDFLPL